MNSENNEENTIIEDWLEFETYWRQTKALVNIKREEISEVFKFIDDKGEFENKCHVILKNGREYLVNMPYEKVMELV